MVSPVDERLQTIYQTLREIAARRLGAGGKRKFQVDPTELANEVWVKLSAAGHLEPAQRAEFLPLAARAVRSVLVDLVRSRNSLKRGGDRERVTLSGQIAGQQRDEVELLALDEALVELEKVSERQARIVELRYFGGLTVDETAIALGISPRTVDGDWKMARLWLRRALEG